MRREHLGWIYAVKGNGLPTTQGNPVQEIGKELGAEPLYLLDAQERERRQGAVNALMVAGWESAASDLLYADGYGSDAALEVLVNGLTIARGRAERTPAERDRLSAAIREVRSIMGPAS